MKSLAGALVLLMSAPVYSQQSTAPDAQLQSPASAGAPGSAPSTASAGPLRKVRVFVTESSSWQTAGGSGGGRGVFGGGFSGGARPQTAEVIKTIGQRCPNLLVNNKLDASDYVLLLEHEGGKGLLRKKDKVAVFQQRSGDSIFSLSSLSVGGSVQGACDAIEKDWPTYSAHLTETPPAIPGPSVGNAMAGAAPTVAQMASLIVESNVTGADIEVDGSFVGNTPSTLSVVPGKHTVTVKKKGYADWSRSMNIAGNSVHLNADLTATP